MTQLTDGRCGSCKLPAQQGTYRVADSIPPVRMWWHLDPRAMSTEKAHPPRAEFVPEESEQP